MDLKPISFDGDLDVARGVIEGRTSTQKFGRNDNVGTGAEEDIWSGGGDYNFLQAADTVRIRAGGNAADDAAGVGAQQITVEGLDASWDEATETLTTAGAGASASTSGTFIRVLRAYVSQAGTYGGNSTGDVELETTGGTLVAKLLAKEGQTQLGITSVPAGKTLFLVRSRVVVADTNKTASVFAFQRQSADVVSAPFGSKRILAAFDRLAGGADASILYRALPSISEKSDLWFRAIAQTTPASVSVEFDYFLVDNP